MPTEIAKAITAVMAEVHRLKKDDTNSHGGYKYVSVDDFKDLLRPLMAKHGLSLHTTELDYALETLQGRNGPTVNAKITYQFQLRHTSGEADEPERATIMLPHTGAQTAGAAKSYAIKEYLKGRFLVSTGDKDMIEGGADADAFKPQEYTEAPRPAQMPSVNGKPGASKAAFREDFDKMTKAIRNAPNKTALKALWTEHAADIDEWPTDFVDEIKVEYMDRKSDLEKVLA
jgi:hypothetical protein